MTYHEAWVGIPYVSQAMTLQMFMQRAVRASLAAQLPPPLFLAKLPTGAHLSWNLK